MKSNYQYRRFLIINRYLLAALLCFSLMPSLTLADSWQYPEVNRIVALSDIHGAYGAMTETLKKAAVIDDSFAWIGGNTHLVVTGDLLDRGPESRKVMDLIMRLEREAARDGGRVHQLLGNHEVMNLIGDLRYVADEEYAAFADDESAEEREYWYQLFRNTQPEDADELTVRSEFDQKAPPGFFGHRRAFRNDGAYGKWLLSKPLMVVINDIAFVHGGAPPYVAEHGLAGVNDTLKTDLLNYMTAISTLEDASILSPINSYREAPSVLTEKIESGKIEDEMMPWAQAIYEFRESPLQGPEGPTWYRGTATCNRLIEGDSLNAALERVGATKIVFGHTPTDTRRVQQRMDGRIIEIDTGMLKANYRGSGNALVIQDQMVTVTNQDGTKDLSPTAHPRGVGNESDLIDDDTLENILSSGTVVNLSPDTATWRFLQVVAFDKTVFAYFRPSPAKKGFAPEVAAYRLDRMLGLYMVPVTVRREINGQQGTLQYVPVETLSERERVTSGKGQRAVCSMAKQQAAMSVFDTLINNPARTPQSMLYSPDDWQLMLVDHGNSFGTRKDRSAHTGEIELSIGNEWRTALLALDDKKLKDSLGDVLDKSSLSALVKRRDVLLKHPNH